MKPKAMVTMARYGPATRSAGSASAVPTRPVRAAATASAAQKLAPYVVVRMAVV